MIVVSLPCPPAAGPGPAGCTSPADPPAPIVISRVPDSALFIIAVGPGENIIPPAPPPPDDGTDPDPPPPPTTITAVL